MATRVFTEAGVYRNLKQTKSHNKNYQDPILEPNVVLMVLFFDSVAKKAENNDKKLANTHWV
jgi:hypothetical protein